MNDEEMNIAEEEGEEEEERMRNKKEGKVDMPMMPAKILTEMYTERERERRKVRKSYKHPT